MSTGHHVDVLVPYRRGKGRGGTGAFEMLSAKVKQFILTTAGVILGVIIALWILVLIIQPGPKGRIVVATGGAGGAYHEYAATLVPELAKYGIQLVLRPDIEGTQTISHLMATKPEIDAGFVKGGVAGSLQGRFASEEDRDLHEREMDAVHSVGRLFYEPIWVFYRGNKLVRDLREFNGKRIMIGSTKSGSRLIAAHLLKANGIDPNNSKIVQEDLPDDAGPLIRGEIDAAFVIASPESDVVQKLLRVPGIYLMDFSPEAEAYASRFPYLTKLILRQSVIEFYPDLPSADITLMATQPVLLTRQELHPALTTLLTAALTHKPKSGFDRRGDPILFYRAGAFPSGNDPEYEVAPESRQIYKSGDTPFILRSAAELTARLGLPFWMAAVVNQHGAKLILVLIPALSILLPMARLLPTLYTWTVRRRLIYWYGELKLLENQIEPGHAQDNLFELRGELERIDQAVRRIKVPLAYSDQYYDLRSHIDLVRRRLSETTPRLETAAAE